MTNNIADSTWFTIWTKIAIWATVKFHIPQMSRIQIADDNKHAFVLVDLNKKLRFPGYFRMLTNISRIMLYCWSWWRIRFFVFFSTNGSLPWEWEKSGQRPFWTIVCLLRTLANIPLVLNYSHSIPPLVLGANSQNRLFVVLSKWHWFIYGQNADLGHWFGVPVLVHIDTVSHHLILDAVLLYNPTSIIAVAGSFPSAVANDHRTQLQRWSGFSIWCCHLFQTCWRTAWSSWNRDRRLMSVTSG